MRKTWLWITAGLLSFFLLAGFLSIIRLLSYDRVYPGISIEGVDMSNRTYEEVVQTVKSWRSDQREKKVIVTYKDSTFSVEAQQLDMDVDENQVVEVVWSYGRHGSWWERLKKIQEASAESYQVPLKLEYDESKLAALLEYWREMVDKQPRNAVLSMATGGIIPQEEGQKLELEELRNSLLAAFRKQGEQKMALPVTILYPEITVEELSKTGIRQMISVYSTYFNAKDTNRTTNVKRAANNINGYILYLGDIFSFNDVVGPRDIANGFKEALEIVNGEFVPGIGGGVCQVSSTLYNAALLADLAIVDRTNHSKPLNYVPLGLDATVAYGALDFKFKNTSGMPIMILAEVYGNKLMVGLFGQHGLDKNVTIYTMNRHEIPSPIVKETDPALKAGEVKVEKEGSPGYGVTTVRVVSAGEKEIKREVLYKDVYMPDTTILKVAIEQKTPPPAVEENKKEALKPAS